MANNTSYEMNEKKEDSIDLLDLVKKLLRYWWLLILAALVGGVLAGGYSRYKIAPKYRAECMVYVNNGSIKVGSTSVSLADLDASQSLVDTYMVILKSRSVLMEVAEKADVDYSYNTMKQIVSAGKIQDTEVFSIYVTETDPYEAELIANTIAEVLPDAIADIVEGSSVKIVDYAVVPSERISPNNKKNAMMGAMGGLVIVLLLLALKILTNTTIQSDQDLFALTRYPLLTKVPDRKGGNGRKRKHSGADASYEKYADGKDMSFELSEAYRLLRTNVIYSLTSGEKGKIIGITSSVAAEFKTTTAVNLALSMAGYLAVDHKKRVLLLDCDLRMSQIAKRMGLDNKRGLTDYLTGDLELATIVQTVEGYDNLDVIVGGNSSPNPGELLSSDKMKACFEKLAAQYDYVIVDFPPANIVTDALVLGKECDGMLLVVRQNYTHKNAFEEMNRKLKFLSVNVLGIVFTGIDMGRSYNRKYYYSKYYGSSKKTESDAEHGDAE